MQEHRHCINKRHANQVRSCGMKRKWKWKSLSPVQLCNPMDYAAHGILQARILEWVAVPFSRGFFPTHGSNPGLLHCRQILYQLNHQRSPRILEWVAYPFSCRSPWPWNRTRVSCITGGFFTSWATREAHVVWPMPYEEKWEKSQVSEIHGKTPTGDNLQWGESLAQQFFLYNWTRHKSITAQ